MSDNILFTPFTLKGLQLPNRIVMAPMTRGMAGIPFFHGDAALAGWQGVADAVHAAGGKIGPQI